VSTGRTAHWAQGVKIAVTSSRREKSVTKAERQGTPVSHAPSIKREPFPDPPAPPRPDFVSAHFPLLVSHLHHLLKPSSLPFFKTSEFSWSPSGIFCLTVSNTRINHAFHQLFGLDFGNVQQPREPAIRVIQTLMPNSSPAQEINTPGPWTCFKAEDGFSLLFLPTDQGDGCHFLPRHDTGAIGSRF